MKKENYTRRDFVLKSTLGLGGMTLGKLPVSAEKLRDNFIAKREGKGNNIKSEEDDIVIENTQMRLVIGANGITKSLVTKSGNKECLYQGAKIPISMITQERPYNNEIKLAFPCEEMSFQANSIEREGNLLTIGYELIHYKTKVKINIQPTYVEFKLAGFVLTGDDDFGLGVMMKNPAVWKVSYLQLPIKKRTYFGDWLRVVWDQQVATNILATCPFTKINVVQNEDYFLMQANAERAVKLKDVSVALITCNTNKLLDNIENVELDFDLAQGVKSRRSKEYKYSYYWTGDLNMENVNHHLKYAKMGGFRAMSIYCFAFLAGKGYDYTGDYEWDRKLYPKGKDDLKEVLSRIKREGIIPGLHTLHSFIGLKSSYISPIPDRRLNLVQRFTLSVPIDEGDDTIVVDEDPSSIEMTNGRRVLKVGDELISYTGFKDTYPYKITGCERGILGTKKDSHPDGLTIGVLDISEFGARSVYINQDNDLQDEMGRKLADFYDSGFEFCYFDGSEGVNAPFWCNIARSQSRVYKQYNPEPLFSEGAAKTHFSWHMLSRGNAFDVFRPELIKQSIKEHPAAEAPRMQANFSHLNFGWLGYFLPDEETVGTQPDMLEYATSRAAAWDCHISMQANLDYFDRHPRTIDNLEVLRRWEDVRINNWLTNEQKEALKNLDQEHILLINEQNEYELKPYDQIKDVAGEDRNVRAFIFERSESLYVVYWHVSDSKQLEIPLNRKNVTIFEDLQDSSPVSIRESGEAIIIPVGARRYLKITNVTKDQIISAFGEAVIV